MTREEKLWPAVTRASLLLARDRIFSIAPLKEFKRFESVSRVGLKARNGVIKSEKYV